MSSDKILPQCASQLIRFITRSSNEMNEMFRLVCFLFFFLSLQKKVRNWEPQYGLVVAHDRNKNENYLFFKEESQQKSNKKRDSLNSLSWNLFFDNIQDDFSLYNFFWVVFNFKIGRFSLICHRNFRHAFNFPWFFYDDLVAFLKVV